MRMREIRLLKWESDEVGAKRASRTGGGKRATRRERRKTRRETSREFVCRCPTEENSHEVAPTVLAHTSPTVVSAAVTALLKITVGHFVGLCSFAIFGVGVGGDKTRKNSH